MFHQPITPTKNTMSDFKSCATVAPAIDDTMIIFQFSLLILSRLLIAKELIYGAVEGSCQGGSHGPLRKGLAVFPFCHCLLTHSEIGGQGGLRNASRLSKLF